MRRLVLLLAVLLLSASAVGPVNGERVGQNLDPDGVLLVADVAADGSAAWTIEHRVLLDDENATAAFEAVREEIENGTAYRDRFRARMEATVADAEDATGREMAVEDVRVTAEIRELPQSYGVVVYRFRWVGFAAVDSDRLRVDRVLGGLFLTDGSRFVVTWPTDYALRSVDPAPDSRGETRVSWGGPMEFGPRGPSFTLVDPEGSVSSVGGVDGDARDTGGASRVVGDGLLIGGIGSLVVGLVALVLMVRRRGGKRIAPDAADTGTRDGTAATDGELLSSEERVLRLLDERGGRVKQGEVADALDWSDARTSQVVGDLRERGTVVTYRVGRENVVAGPEE